MPAAQPTRPLPDPSGDQRRAQQRPDGHRHGLAADPAAVRPALLARPESRRRAQPRGALAEVEGPGAALTLVDGIDLDGYHVFHAIRADLLRRLGHTAEAVLAYEAAIARTENATERDFLQHSRAALTQGRRDQPPDLHS